MSLYVYAETAFNHEGDIDYLMELVKKASEAGVMGIKFQVLLDLETFTSSSHSAYGTIKTWVFSKDEWQRIFSHAKDQGLDIIMMPLDEKSFELADEFDVAYLDLHSVSFHDKRVLARVKATDIPLILGVGGRTLEEIAEKVEYFSDREIVLMSGFQSYPSRLEDIKLGRIEALTREFPSAAIGYADHTDYSSHLAVSANEYAYLLGATIFEKHLTLEEGLSRIDYEAAVGPEKLASIVERLAYLDSLMSVKDEVLFEMSEAEVVYRNRQKVAVANSALETGTALKESDVAFKMIDKPNGLIKINSVIGKTLKHALAKDEIITQEDFE